MHRPDTLPDTLKDSDLGLTQSTFRLARRYRLRFTTLPKLDDPKWTEMDRKSGVEKRSNPTRTNSEQLRPLTGAGLPRQPVYGLVQSRLGNLCQAASA